MQVHIPSRHAPLHRRLAAFILAAVVSLFLLAPAPARADGVIKTWTTAELVGAMRWAKKEAPKADKGGYIAAELVAYKRLQKQIEARDISKTTAFLIAETTRKKGVYKGDPLTLERAEDLRKLIIGGRLFEKLTD